VVVVNDTGAAVSGTLQITLGDPAGSEVCAFQAAINVAHGRRQTVAVRLAVPVGIIGACTYGVALSTAAGQDAWQRELRFRPAERQVTLPGSVAVIGDGGLLAVLARLGVTVRRVTTAAQAAGCAILVVAPFTVVPGSTINREIGAFCATGGRVVVLEQATSPFTGVPLQDLALQTVWRRAPGHPLLAGLDDADFAFWGDTAYSDVTVGAALARRGYRKDDGSRVEVLIDGGEGQFGNGDLEQAHLISVREGSGVVLACQLRLAELQAVIPVARELLCRLLEQAAAWQAPQPVPLIELHGACSPATLDAACAKAQEGATVVVRGAPRATLDLLAARLGVALVTTARPGYQAVRTGDDPLLAGVSHADLCGVEHWTYADWSDPKPDNRVVVPVPLAASPGLEALLVIPRLALTEEMFVRGLNVEPLRAYAATVFRYRNTPDPAPEIAVGRIRHGAGHVLIDRCEFPADQPKPRLRYGRLAHALRRNLGHGLTGGLLAGAAVEPPANSGPGFPVVALASTAAIPWAEAVDGTTLAVDGFYAKAGVLNREVFTEVAAIAGGWPVGLAGTGSVDLYVVLTSPTVRRNLANDFGCPNPEALTFLDASGCGTVSLAVDGRDFASQALSAGSLATFPDIPLAQGRNHVLLRWTCLLYTSDAADDM
jgi:hypothetical protein